MHPRHLGAAAAALAGALALAPAATAPAAVAPAATCSPVKNIEAIVDDSGSMAITDPNRLRVAALNLLIDTPGNERILLGAVEFGGQFGTFPGQPPASDTVFPPEAIGPNAAAMRAALDQKIHADNGLTDYNAAFAQAKADNPNANARIFLTDGGHDAGPYNNGHAGGPPTYVIGFGSATTGADGARLQQIASETHGKYFPQTDSSKLQAVMNEIGTTLTCQSPPVRFTDAFKRVGQGKSHAVALARSVRSVQLTLTWANPADKFTVSRVRIVNHGRTVALARARRLKLTTRRGATFLVVKVGGITRGSLRFTVKPTTLAASGSRVTLTTQVTQSRRR
jgi:hypothetical protein